MVTKYIKIEQHDIINSDIKEAGEILKRGGLVAFPTETVYGLGANGLDETAARRIYEAKGRPSDNPLILHISEMEELESLALEIPETAKRLAEAFWPGPMTLVFKKKPIVPYGTTGGLDTVAVRMPSHPVARAMIKAAGLPIAAPSANRSGRPSPTKASHVREDMDGIIDMIIDGGEVGIGLESTIIDVSEGTPMILRPGYITQEMIAQVTGEVEVDKAILGKMSEDFRPKAPGMKYRHYAPKAEMTIYRGSFSSVCKAIWGECEKAKKEGKRVGVICTEESKDRYGNADVLRCIGSRQDPESIAHNLFDVLRSFDEAQVDVIYSECFEDSPLGFAIMNRLNKAAGHRIVDAAD